MICRCDSLWREVRFTFEHAFFAEVDSAHGWRRVGAWSVCRLGYSGWLLRVVLACSEADSRSRHPHPLITSSAWCPVCCDGSAHSGLQRLEVQRRSGPRGAKLSSLLSADRVNLACSSRVLHATSRWACSVRVRLHTDRCMDPCSAYACDIRDPLTSPNPGHAGR